MGQTEANRVDQLHHHDQVVTDTQMQADLLEEAHRVPSHMIFDCKYDRQIQHPVLGGRTISHSSLYFHKGCKIPGPENSSIGRTGGYCGSLR